MSMYFKAVSHLGLKRKKNEDRCFAKKQIDGSLLLVVADGMGGAAGGEKAATEAIAVYSDRSERECITPDSLRETLFVAHNMIAKYVKSHKDFEEMGTTLTAALVRDGMIYWAHVGDSRLYVVKNGSLKQLTTDHRFLDCLIKEGYITLEHTKQHPLKNVLDQCLGCPEINPEYGSVRYFQDSLVLICTDGLYDEVSHDSIERILNMKVDIETKSELLMSAALISGGRDNVTFVLALADCR